MQCLTESNALLKSSATTRTYGDLVSMDVTLLSKVMSTAVTDLVHSDSRFQSIHRFFLNDRFESIRFVKKISLSIL